MVDSFKEDSFTPDSFEEETENPRKTFLQGFFKTYEEDKPRTLAQKVDIGVAKAAKPVMDTVSTGLDILNAPFEVAGEIGRRGVVEANNPGKFRAPSVVQRFFPSTRTEEPPANPISLINKMLRAGAGAVSGIPGGTPLESARAAYNAPRGMLGAAEDTATGLLLGKISPELLTAPADAALNAATSAVKTGKNVAAAVGKKVVRAGLGPTEKAQEILYNRPQDVARQTDFVDLGDRFAKTTDELQGKLSQLDDAAWETLQNPSAVKGVYYHGTNAPEQILAGGFRTHAGAQKGSTYLGDNFAKGVYLSKDLSPYKEGGDLADVADVLRIKHEFQNPLRTTYQGVIDLYKKARIDQFDSRGPTKFSTWVKKQGYDAIELGTEGKVHEVIALYPERLKAETINTIGKDQLLAILNKARIEFTGKGGTKIGGADQQAVAQIGKYMSKVKALKGTTGAVKKGQLGQDQVKEIIQSIQKDARYDLPSSDPVNRAVKSVRAQLDAFLKEMNPDYAESMKPVAEATAALKEAVKKFRLERKGGEYVPTKTTISRLEALAKGDNPELTRVAEQLKSTTGIDFADEAILTTVKREFAPGIQRSSGSRRAMIGGGVGAGIGAAVSKAVGIPAPAGAAVGGALGTVTGGAMDYYGGASARKIIDTLSRTNSGVGNVLAAINQKSQGTAFQDVIKRLLEGERALAPVIRGNR